VGIISDFTARDVASVFYNLNLLFTFLAGVIILRKHDLLTALIALGCTAALVDYFGKALLDAGIFFWVVLALYLAEQHKTALLGVVVLLSTAVHPIAFALCSIIFAFNVDKREVPFLLGPLAIYYIYFMPTSYAVLMLHGPMAVISVLLMLNAQWFGAFTLRRDKESLMILVMFCACCGFSLLMTWPARTFVMLSPVLAPRLVEMIRNDTANTRIVEEASETHEGP
jgi:hypothetical protein